MTTTVVTPEVLQTIRDQIVKQLKKVENQYSTEAERLPVDSVERRQWTDNAYGMRTIADDICVAGGLEEVAERMAYHGMHWSDFVVPTLKALGVLKWVLEMEDSSMAFNGCVDIDDLVSDKEFEDLHNGSPRIHPLGR